MCCNWDLIQTFWSGVELNPSSIEWCRCWTRWGNLAQAVCLCLQGVFIGKAGANGPPTEWQLVLLEPWRRRNAACRRACETRYCKRLSMRASPACDGFSFLRRRVTLLQWANHCRGIGRWACGLVTALASLNLTFLPLDILLDLVFCQYPWDWDSWSSVQWVKTPAVDLWPCVTGSILPSSASVSGAMHLNVTSREWNDA